MQPIIFPLQPGDNNHDVANLKTALQLLLRNQRVLTQDGPRLKELMDNETGYGDGTQRTVAVFQQAKHIQPTGIIDEGTATELNRELIQLGAIRGVDGYIYMDYGIPANNIKLRLYAKGYGGNDTLVAESHTTGSGRYAFEYNPGGITTANFEVRAVDVDGREHSLSGTLYNDSKAAAISGLNLIAPEKVQPISDSEFSRLSKDINAVITDISKLKEAQEKDDRQDITFLSQATNWDARAIALASHAANLSQATSISHEASYALVRAGLPTDADQLAQLNAEDVDKALVLANEAGITNLDGEQRQAAVAAFKTFANTVRLNTKDVGSLSTYGDFLTGRGLSPDQQKAFSNAYFAPRKSSEELWQNAKAAGIPDNKIKELQLQGKLGFLTSNNAQLANNLQASIHSPDNLSKLVDDRLYEPDAWDAKLKSIAGTNDDNAEVLKTLIPPSYMGDCIAEMKQAYTEDLADKIRTAFPEKVLRKRIETGSIPVGNDVIKNGVVNFLQKAEGMNFKFGVTHVEKFAEENNSALFNGVSDEQKKETIKFIKTLHRIHQITPDDEAMQVMIDLGYKYAHDVADLPEEYFLGKFEKRYLEKYRPLYPEKPRELARLIYNKSHQVKTTTYSFYTAVQHMQNTPPVYGISGSAAKRSEEQRQMLEKIKGFPNLQQLFGSLDFCECKHCRSILSPAAYLVDLLQFLDRDENHWNYFLDKWKEDHGGQEYSPTYSKPYDALIARRPDIVNLPLTCENTNTALPYIDIVNEILEYSIANKNLEKLSFDTGKATSPELLAEPQNIEPTAYSILRQAKYPFELPFDLWIETVRLFCDQYEISLWQLMRDLNPVSNQSFETTKKISAESLHISPAEYAIFINESLSSLAELYGYSDENSLNTDLKSAKKLANRLGVTYKELSAIIQTRFINPYLDELIVLHKMSITVNDVFRYKLATGFEPFKATELQVFEDKLKYIKDTFGTDAKATIENLWNQNIFHQILLLNDTNAVCNFDETKVGYANEDALKFDWLKFNLFVRLWRKLGWSIDEVDHVLNALIPQQLLTTIHDFSKPEADRSRALGKGLASALINIAHLKILASRVITGKQAFLKLATLWAELPTSLYAQLFLSRNTLKIDTVFDDALGKYLNKDILIRENQKDHTLSIQAALNLSDAEISQILQHEGQDIVSAKLTLQNISLLYRYSLLAKGLKLSVSELISLIKLSGLKPFTPLSVTAISKEEEDNFSNQTLRFVEWVIKVKESGFKIEDLNYLFCHQFDPVGKYRTVSSMADNFLKAIANEINRIRREHPVPTNPGKPDDLSPFAEFNDEVLQQKLALALPVEKSQAFFAMWTGRQNKDWPLLKDNINGFLSESEFDSLFIKDPLNADNSSKQKSILQKRATLAKKLMPFIQQKLIRESVIQILADAISANPVRVDWLINDPKYLHDVDNPEASLFQILSQANEPAKADKIIKAFILISKTNQVAEGLKLSDRELQYFITNAKDFDDLDFNKIPAAPELLNAKLLFKAFIRLCDYVIVRQYFAGEGTELVDVFEKARGLYDSNEDEASTKQSHLKSLHEQIANLTRRDLKTVEEIATKLEMKASARFEEGKLKITADDFANERGLLKLWKGMQAVQVFGISVQALSDAITITSSGSAEDKSQAIAQDLKNAVKARYEAEQWQQIAQPIFDKLRQKKRDALVSYMLHTNRDLFDSVEEMYEYFLIDPGTEPVVQTSRIRIASASVQLFIQRCLLNLENRWNMKVPPGAINSKYWMWMNRYRVWEANRKIFLWPENWLEPEWRDDKTFLFKELEGKLLQSDVSNDVVEEAFFVYLKGLEKLARLDIVSMYCEEDKVTPEANKLHVISRTFSVPHTYFYRRYAQQMWTPWEPIDTEIDGDHIVTVMWRGRLHLFWVTFLEKIPQENKPVVADSDSSTTLANWNVKNAVSAVTSGTNIKVIEAYLHWSEYNDGQWSTRQSGTLEAPIEARVSIGMTPKDIAVYVTKEPKNEIDDTLDGAIKINLSSINKAFRVVNKNSSPEILSNADALPKWPFAEAFKVNKISGKQGPFNAKFEHFQKIVNNQLQSIDSSPQTIFGKTVGNFKLIPCSEPVTMGGPELGHLVTPYFYQDSWHTFYVEPALTETRTIDEWDEWVEGPPVFYESNKPEWGGIKIDPIFPWPRKIPKPQPGDPGWLELGDTRIKVSPKMREDWVTRPGTYIKFDERVIGNVSGMNLLILNNAGKANVIKDSGQLNTIINNSSVVSNVILVSPDAVDKTASSGITEGATISVRSSQETKLVGGNGMVLSGMASETKHFGGVFGRAKEMSGNKLLKNLSGGFK